MVPFGSIASIYDPQQYGVIVPLCLAINIRGVEVDGSVFRREYVCFLPFFSLMSIVVGVAIRTQELSLSTSDELTLSVFVFEQQSLGSPSCSRERNARARPWNKCVEVIAV